MWVCVHEKSVRGENTAVDLSLISSARCVRVCVGWEGGVLHQVHV